MRSSSWHCLVASYPDLYDGGIAGYGFNSQVSQWGGIATALRHYDVIARRGVRKPSRRNYAGWT